MFIFARQEVRGYFDLRYSRPFGLPSIPLPPWRLGILNFVVFNSYLPGAISPVLVKEV